MGRKLKKGLDYFPLYHDFFTNKKTQALRRAHSHVGILTYLNILCRVYDNGYYYRFDDFDELCMDIAEEIANEQLRRTATGVAETINYLVGRGILDEGLFKQGVISGVALQEQYVMSSYKAKRKIEMGVYCLLQKSEEAADVGGSIPKNEISSEEMPIYSEEMAISSEESTQSKSKRKSKSETLNSLSESNEAECPEIFIRMALKDGTYYDVPKKSLSRYRELYRRIDIESELRKMCGWLEGNPSRRKTKGGMPRFIHSWFARASEGAEAKQKASQNQKQSESASFDVDDFFEAAVRRSYKDFKGNNEFKENEQ